jgi:hypothetical protein
MDRHRFKSDIFFAFAGPPTPSQMSHPNREISRSIQLGQQKSGGRVTSIATKAMHAIGTSRIKSQETAGLLTNITRSST